MEACDVANEDQSSDSCTNLALNSQIKLHDESGVKEGNISMTNSGSQDLELKTQHELDQSNFKLKDLSIVLKKCVVPELSGLNNSFKFEDNIIENENDKIRLKSHKQNILHNQKNQQNSEQQKNSSTSPIIPKQVFAQQNPIKPLRFDKENKTPIKRSKKRHTTNEIKDVSSAPAEDLSSKRSKSFSCKKQAITVSPVPTKNPTDKPIQPKGPKSRIEEGVSEGSIINPSSESKSSLDEPVQHSVTEYNERRKQILSLRDATSRSRELIVKKLRRDALAKPQTPISNFRIQDVFGSEDES